MANEKQIIQKSEQEKLELETPESSIKSSSTSEEDSPVTTARVLSEILIKLKKQKSILSETKGNEDTLRVIEKSIQVAALKLVNTLKVPADEGDHTYQLLLANALRAYYEELGISKRESLKQACHYLAEASDKCLFSTLQLADIYKNYPNLKRLGTPVTISKWFLDSFEDLSANKNTRYKDCYKDVHAALTDCFTVYLHSQSNAVLEQLKRGVPNKKLHDIIDGKYLGAADFAKGTKDDLNGKINDIINAKTNTHGEKLSDKGLRVLVDQSTKSFEEKYRISQSELQMSRK